jgi:hypothetical protein
VTGPACTRLLGAARSTTVPHAWHSPQRPTHFAVSQPHSPQWYAAAAALLGALPFAMVRTYVPTPTGSVRRANDRAVPMI